MTHLRWVPPPLELLLSRLSIEIRMNVEPALLVGFLLLDHHRMRLGICVVTDRSDLPRDFHSRRAAGNAEVVVRHFLSHMQAGRSRADGRQLVAEVGIYGF